MSKPVQNFLALLAALGFVLMISTLFLFADKLFVDDSSSTSNPIEKAIKPK